MVATWPTRTSTSTTPAISAIGTHCWGGAAAGEICASFERLWRSKLAVPREHRLDGVGLFERKVALTRSDVRDTYDHLMRYAADPANFAPDVRGAIAAMPTAFPALAQTLRWSRTSFLSDMPGKNANR